MGNLLFHASDEEYWENIPQDKSRGKVKKTIMLENDIFCLTNSYRIIEFYDISVPLSFPRRRESSIFNNFLDSRLHGNDIFGRNSKLSKYHRHAEKTPKQLKFDF